MILHLGFGEGRLLHGRPHHGLGALIQRAVHQKLHEFFGDDTLGMKVHRQIGFGPIASDTQPLELLALDVDPALGKFPALRPEFVDRHRVFVFALFAVLLLDLPFNREAVTIPARDIAAVMAHHLVRAHDDVLDRFVERVANMEMAIGVRRPVMERERRAALFFAQAVVNADLFPTRKPIGLTLGQSRTHREVGFRQVQRVFVIRHIGLVPRRLLGRVGGSRAPGSGGSIRAPGS